MKAEELTKKREEAERKARRGEIDPTHEFTFHLIGQVETGYFGKTLSPPSSVLWAASS